LVADKGDRLTFVTDSGLQSIRLAARQKTLVPA
jgi:hypothetical protein